MGLSKTAWRVAGALALVALGGVLLGLWQRGSESKPALSVAPVPSQAAARTLDQVLALPQAAPAASDALAPRLVEVCGQPPAWTVGLEYIPEPVFQEIIRTEDRVLRKLGAQLSRDTDPFTQAVGLSIQGGMEIQDRIKERTEKAQGQHQPPPDRPMLTDSERRLIDMAARSTDPRIHALALNHCQAMRGLQSQCDELSWQRTATLAPNNGYLWLLAARSERDAGNPQAERESLDRLIRAPQFDTFEPQRFALLAAAALRLSSPFERLAMAFDTPLDGGHGDTLISVYLKSRCSRNSAPAERARCERVAMRLAQTPSVWSRNLGYELSVELAPDQQRVQALNEEHMAMNAQDEAQRGKGLHLDPSCAAADAHLKAVVAAARRSNKADQPVTKERGQ